MGEDVPNLLLMPTARRSNRIRRAGLQSNAHARFSHIPRKSIGYIEIEGAKNLFDWGRVQRGNTPLQLVKP